MRFHSESSSLSSLIKAGFTSAFALAILAACSDKISAPTGADRPADAGIVVVETQVSDSEKNPAIGPSGSMLKAPGSAAMLVSPSAASSFAMGVGYSVLAVPFAPEAAPTANAGPNCDDCVMFNVPLGFSFIYYGTTYTKLNISSNGFLGFGATMGHGCCRGGAIPSNDVTNNIIALAWSDWMPNRVVGGIRYETRGTAPNRRFVLQFNNVPEYGAIGRLTVQVVLAEESNEITIYAPSMSVSRSDHIVTQGTENSVGTIAAFVPGRVRNFFNLSSDAVRFTPTPNQRPVLTMPANISLVLDIGACAAVVNAGSAIVTDDTDGFSLLPVRSDALAHDAPYSRGVTTIAWTVTDAGGLIASANQTVTINDQENPSITAPASISADNDPGMGSAALAAGRAVAADNCPNVAVAGARSDGAVFSAAYPVGMTTITWTASDESGNSALATQTVMVRDVEAPSISVANIELDATMRNGAVVSFVTPASDNVGVTGVSCTRQSGSIFPVGSTSVTCTAVDAAGNRAAGTFVVTVHGAAEQIIALIGFVEGLELHNGTANPMLNQLRHALDDVENESGASCKKMNDFLRMVTSRKGSEIFGDDSAKMLADARRILSVLGCQ